MTIQQPFTPLEGFYYWEKMHAHLPYLHYASNGIWDSISWEEVGNQARRIALALNNFGVGKAKRVCILSENCPHWIISDLAIMMSGAASAPAFTTMSPKDVLYILKHSGAETLIVGKAQNWPALKAVLPDSIRTIALPDSQISDTQYQWNDLLDQFEPLLGNPMREREEELTTVYTSGSTGLPKGVMYSFDGAAHIAKNLIESYRVETNDRMISYLPMAHGFERAIVDFMSLVSGYQVFFAQSQETFSTDMQTIQPTIFQCVPRLWTKFQQAINAKFGGKEQLDILLSDTATATKTQKQVKQALGLSESRILFTGSAPTPLPLHEWFAALDMPLCEIYGQSEILSGTSNLPWDRKPGTLGKPTANTQIKISEHGEILIKAKAVMMGYLNEPEKTKETLVNGWIHTGDKGELDEDGFLIITGRVKEIFKTAKGKYVAPVPIEGPFISNPYIEQVCLIGSGLPQTALVVQLSALGHESRKKDVERAIKDQVAVVNASQGRHAQIGNIIISKDEWGAHNNFLTHTMKIKRTPIEKHFMPLAEQAFADNVETNYPSIYWEHTA